MNRSLKERVMSAVIIAATIHVIEAISGNGFSVFRIAWLGFLYLVLDYAISAVVKKFKER